MLKRNLGSMAMSLGEIIIGILLLVNPVTFTSGIVVAFGIVLVITGIGTTIKYFRTEPEEAAVRQILVSGIVDIHWHQPDRRCCFRHGRRYFRQPGKERQRAGKCRRKLIKNSLL